MRSRHYRILPCAIFLFAVACDSGGSELSRRAAGLAGWASLHAEFGAATYNSGFDGVNSYQVPMAFIGDGDLQVTVSNPQIASASAPLPIPTPPQLPQEVTFRAVILTTNSPGTVQVTATLDGQPYPAQLSVLQYQSTDVAVGDQFYNSPQNCIQCHATLSRHSTAFLADLTDDQLLQVAAGGGVQTRDLTTGQLRLYQPNNGQHTFSIAGAERGILAYLRSRGPTFQLPREL